MSAEMDQHHEYDDQFVAGLEWIWGEGFMSPGGSAEIATILNDIDLNGRRVLDIGCGIGGADVVLVQTHGAAHVLGIDVEAPLIAKATQRVADAQLEDRIECQLVTPGKLPFEDATFDVVFSKDSIVHVADKAAIYREMYRVLKPGGRLAYGDWFGAATPPTPEFEEWLAVVGLTFGLGTIEAAGEVMRQSGFENIRLTDRNAWYAQNIKEELATLQGDQYARLVAEQGADAAAQRLKSSSAKQVVVDQGQLRPGHIQATKPA